MGYRRLSFRGWHLEGMRELRARGHSYRQIAKAFECHPETVREALDPELKARRNARRLERYHERAAGND